jgi:hypothetical protein
MWGQGLMGKLQPLAISYQPSAISQKEAGQLSAVSFQRPSALRGPLTVSNWDSHLRRTLRRAATRQRAEVFSAEAEKTEQEISRAGEQVNLESRANLPWVPRSPLLRSPVHLIP